MKKISILLLSVLLLCFSACGGDSGGSSASDDFRLLQVGDSWTFVQQTTFSSAQISPLNYVHDNTVTVVQNAVDGAGQVYPGLAFKSEYTQISGPDAPVGTEYELFAQDPVTREVTLKGNITATGAFLPKSGTIYLGSYKRGTTHTYDGDVNDQLITFIGTVVGKEDVDALGTTLRCWVVDLVEASEPEGQDFHSNGDQNQKIYPDLGSRVESKIAFDIGSPFFGRFEVASKIKSTNVPF